MAITDPAEIQAQMDHIVAELCAVGMRSDATRSYEAIEADRKLITNLQARHAALAATLPSMGRQAGFLEVCGRRIGGDMRDRPAFVDPVQAQADEVAGEPMQRFMLETGQTWE